MVTSSMPRPTPVRMRHTSTPTVVDCIAMMQVAAVYQSSDHVKTARLPKVSAATLKTSVPMKSPVKVAPRTLRGPLKPKSVVDPAVKRPLRTRPGPM